MEYFKQLVILRWVTLEVGSRDERMVVGCLADTGAPYTRDDETGGGW
jgi:hypothetical protein